MPELSEEQLEDFFNNIQKQFLCCYPLHCIRWQDFPTNLTWNQQKNIIDVTHNFHLNKIQPIKLGYQINFLRKLIEFLEQTYTEVHDSVYESYCQAQQNVARDCTEKYAFKHYVLDANTQFTLRESKSFVSEGTTGLCSWQASLALADFMLRNPDITRNKSALELGAGTGLCGLIIMKMCQPRHLILSDGSDACVQLMSENIKRNFPNASEQASHKFAINDQIVECSVIPWHCINEMDEVTSLKPDLLFAADVVYDDTCFDDLSFAIDFVFNLQQNKVQMYLAATVRNEHTLKGFLSTLDCLNFKLAEHPAVPPEYSLLYWDRSTPVKIFHISRGL